MIRNQLPDLDPGRDEILSEEVIANDDVLVKAFALGPGATIEPHIHADSSNIFHIVRGRVTVIQDDAEIEVSAPGVIFHPRGTVHGARNDSPEPVALTATLAPFP